MTAGLTAVRSMASSCRSPSRPRRSANTSRVKLRAQLARDRTPKGAIMFGLINR